MDERAINRLTSIGVPVAVAPLYAELFLKSSTLGQLSGHLTAAKAGHGTGQFLMSQFQRLAAHHPEFLDQAEDVLAGYGVSAQHIREHMTAGYEAEIMFALRHETDYPFDAIIVPFRERANQFALEKMRQWLGFQDKR